MDENTNTKLEMAMPSQTFKAEKEEALKNTDDDQSGSRKSKRSGNKDGSVIKNMTQDLSIVAYGYVADLKAEGHTSLGDLIFRDTMRTLYSASLASESIGRDRFLENLENGFYATGRLLVYLEFAGSLGVNESTRLALSESVTAVHKIYAASVKTVKNNKPVKPSGVTV